MLTWIAVALWETKCVNFVGALPHTTLMVIVDKPSKWAEIAAVRQATAVAFLKVFRERIITRGGTPKTLILDNGVQFTGKKTKTAKELWRVR